MDKALVTVSLCGRHLPQRTHLPEPCVDIYDDNVTAKYLQLLHVVVAGCLQNSFGQQPQLHGCQFHQKALASTNPNHH